MKEQEIQLFSSDPPNGYEEVTSEITGIRVFKPIDDLPAKLETVKGFSCPQCGGSTAFNIQAGVLQCDYCGHQQSSEGNLVGKQAAEREFNLELMHQDGKGWGEFRRELSCQNCGVRFSIPVEDITHTCAFCGSSKVLQYASARDTIRPNFIIPFKIDQTLCRKVIAQFLGSSWMLPRDLKVKVGDSPLQPIYLSYWTFDAALRSSWKAQVGHTKSVRYYNASNRSWETRTETEWRWEQGQVKLQVDDQLEPGSDRLSKLHLAKVGHFNLRDLQAYEPSYLAGFHAQAFEVSLDTAWERARHKMREKMRMACRSQASTQKIRNFSMSLDFDSETWRYLLLPFYVASFNYLGMKYQLILNGQSGQVSGQRPVDWQKIWLVMAGLVSPGVLFGLVGLLTLPVAGLGVFLSSIGVFLFIVGVVISIVIGVKASQMDDD